MPNIDSSIFVSSAAFKVQIKHEEDPGCFALARIIGIYYDGTDTHEIAEYVAPNDDSSEFMKATKEQAIAFAARLFDKKQIT